MGGRWTLRDIVDYELIATMGLLEAAADQRGALLRQIYEVNRVTVENGAKTEPAAVVIPVSSQFEPRAAIRLADKLQLGGVEVWRAGASFDADGKTYPAGTLVVPMTQVFARYAKDLLEKQTYPEVRRTPSSPPEPPYDVTAWSLGMLMGADVAFAKKPLPAAAQLTKLTDAPALAGAVTGTGSRFTFRLQGPRRRAGDQPAAEGRREGGVRAHGRSTDGGRHRRARESAWTRWRPNSASR